jgi:WD40 repeat protein
MNGIPILLNPINNEYSLLMKCSIQIPDLPPIDLELTKTTFSQPRKISSKESDEEKLDIMASAGGYALRSIMSPDGQYIYSGGCDGNLRVYDAFRGRLKKLMMRKPQEEQLKERERKKGVFILFFFFLMFIFIIIISS